MESTDTRIITDLAQIVGMELDGRYALKSVLGEGAMGVVFRATQLSIQRDVAIKVLKLGTFRDDASLDRFRREMEIISGLTHPNVVRLLDSGVDDRLGVFYLAMEFIEGVSLGDLLYEAPRRVEPELALEIVYQVCAGLTEPHREGIVHRDIKPDNVLLQIASDDTIRMKVVDFGIAKAAADDQRVTATGVIVGTPTYMAPELCRATGDLDARTDLYALGIMLYELLTGFVPFQADTSLAVMLKQVSEPPPPIATHLEDEIEAQVAIQGLLDELLHKDPKQRPSGAREVRKLIDAIRDDAGMTRVRVDSTRSWAQALAPYLVRTARLPTREEFAIRTTMIMARHTTEQVQPIVTAMAERSRAERRATITEYPPAASAPPDAQATNAIASTEDPGRGPTELHLGASQDTRGLLFWMLGVTACIAILGLVAYQISERSNRHVELAPAEPTRDMPERTEAAEEVSPVEPAAEVPHDVPDAGAGEEPAHEKETVQVTKQPKETRDRPKKKPRKKRDPASSKVPAVEKDPPKEVIPPVAKDPPVKEDPPAKKDPAPKKDPPKDPEGLEWLEN